MSRVAWLILGICAGCRYPELPQLAPADGSVDPDASSDAQSADARPDGGPHTCYVPSTIPGAQVGQAGQPVQGNFFDTPQSGPNMGKLEFIIPGLQFEQTPPFDLLVAAVVKPVGGFAVGQPYAFSTNANPNVQYAARAQIYADYDPGPSTHKQYFYATNGSITFSQIGEAPGSQIQGTMSMTNFVEVDEATGAAIDFACTVSFGELTFYFQQQP